MMRWLMLAVLVILISAAATVFVQYAPGVGGGDPEFPTATNTAPAGPPPVAVVDGDLTYRFKVMPQNTTDDHEWIIRNEGKGDLVLRGGHPACSCTLMNLKDGENVTIKPGETFPLKVKWETRTTTGGYHKVAPIYTNDPKQPELTFTIEGTVYPAIITVPSEPVLDAMNVSNDAPHDFFLAIYSPDKPDMKISALVSSRPDLFELSADPIEESERKQLNAESGYKVRVRVKPTDKLGPFNEEFVIKTDHPLKPEVRQGIVGKIVGPITMTPESIRVHNVDGRRGDSISVMLWSVGHETTHFTIAKQPESLKVTIAPVDEKAIGDGGGRGHGYRMVVTVPPGTQTGIISDPIILQTDHPRATELKVPVYIQVLGES
jgi:hypothetical protein